MTASRPILDPEAATALAQRQIAALESLVDAGLVIVNTLKLQSEVMGREAAGWLADGVSERAYERVSRSIRLSITLQTRIASGETESPRARRDPGKRRRVNEVVEDAIADEAPDTESTEHLLESLDTRMEREFETEFADRPIGEVVAEICRGLGIVPDWNRWTSEGWAKEELRSRPPGSPYSGLPRVRRLANPRVSFTPDPNLPPELTLEEWFEKHAPDDVKQARAERAMRSFDDVGPDPPTSR